MRLFSVCQCIMLYKVFIISEFLNTLAAPDKSLLSTSFLPHTYITAGLKETYAGRLRDVDSVVPGLATRGIRVRRHSRSYATRGCSLKY
jgi:hypothetical protein